MQASSAVGPVTHLRHMWCLSKCINVRPDTSVIRLFARCLGLTITGEMYLIFLSNWMQAWCVIVKLKLWKFYVYAPKGCGRVFWLLVWNACHSAGQIPRPCGKTDYILASPLSVCLSPWLHSCLWPVVKVTGPVVGGDSSPRCGKDDGHPLLPVGGPSIQCTINRAYDYMALLLLRNFN